MSDSREKDSDEARASAEKYGYRKLYELHMPDCTWHRMPDRTAHLKPYSKGEPARSPF